MNLGFWYLATPYSNYPAGRDAACCEAGRVAARLIRAGVLVHCPIVEHHQLAVAYDLGTGFEYWRRIDEAMVRASRGVIVVRMEGWRESIGVAQEEGLAGLLGKPIVYLDPDGEIPEEVRE